MPLYFHHLGSILSDWCLFNPVRPALTSVKHDFLINSDWLMSHLATHSFGLLHFNYIYMPDWLAPETIAFPDCQWSSWPHWRRCAVTCGFSSSAHPGFVSRWGYRRLSCTQWGLKGVHGTVSMPTACTLPTPSSGRGGRIWGGHLTILLSDLPCHCTFNTWKVLIWSFQTWACLILSDLHWLQCQAWFISWCCQTLQFPWKESWMMLILMSWAGWFWMCLSVSLAVCHGHVSSTNLGHWMSLIHVRLTNY